ncbi:hypothetical protein [Azospirillum sp. sgz302134]
MLRPDLDAILTEWRESLGNDFAAYRNHARRMHRFAVALAGVEDDGRIAVAAAFHDLGIWTDGTLDYLEPSARLAAGWLAQQGLSGWTDEVAAMIVNHHKLTPVRGAPLVEAFRRADLVDLSLGLIRFGLPAGLVAEVRREFSNAGFHRRLARLLGRRLRTHPLDPMPMMRL